MKIPVAKYHNPSDACLMVGWTNRTTRHEDVMKITRLDNGYFEVVTDTMMTDGNYLTDGYCRLDPEAMQLRSVSVRGVIRVGSGIRIQLSAARYSDIEALAIGQSFTR
jgi:hypothetical protein